MSEDGERREAVPDDEERERGRKRKGRVPRRAGMEGTGRKGGSDGVNCRRQGHRLYLAGTADTRLRRLYPHDIL